ncbi:MAG: MarR family transcriptional regulator [Candidatus Lokiarchaeota archaeon]|nr:MarR family transcriptional regulator [Candidatus Lokiarchaeota archaeon]
MNADKREQREGGFLIAKIHQIANRIFNKMLKDYGFDELNSGQGRVLFALWQRDNIPISELSVKTQLSKSTLTTMLDRLENKDFLMRETGNDRREIIVNLSDKSKKLKDFYVKISGEMTEVFYGNLTEGERDDFEEYLRRILQNLIEKSKFS